MVDLNNRIINSEFVNVAAEIGWIKKSRQSVEDVAASALLMESGGQGSPSDVRQQASLTARVFKQSRNLSPPPSPQLQQMSFNKIIITLAPRLPTEGLLSLKNRLVWVDHAVKPVLEWGSDVCVVFYLCSRRLQWRWRLSKPHTHSLLSCVSSCSNKELLRALSTFIHCETTEWLLVRTRHWGISEQEIRVVSVLVFSVISDDFPAFFLFYREPQQSRDLPECRFSSLCWKLTVIKRDKSVADETQVEKPKPQRHWVPFELGDSLSELRFVHFNLT